MSYFIEFMVSVAKFQLCHVCIISPMVDGVGIIQSNIINYMIKSTFLEMKIYSKVMIFGRDTYSKNDIF